MRVLYVSHFGGLGGAERSLLELMLAVRLLGVEPRLICPPGPLHEAAVQNNIGVVNWAAHAITRSSGSTGLPRSLPHLARGWAGLTQTIKSFKPDIVHANTMQAMLWIGPVARLRGCRVVWHWRDFYDHGRQARTMARGADAIVAISRSTLSFAADLLGAAAPKLSLILNGVSDLPACDPDQINVTRRSLSIPGDGLLVLMAGQSVPRKGHAVLIEALAGVNKQRSDVHALLLCQEHDRSAVSYTRELRRQAAEIGCDTRVQIRNGVQHLAPMLYAADVVAVPSLREPFGRIAVEAMLARKPVIASDVDGLKEIVQQPETGVLIPPGDPPRLASGLIDMLAAHASLPLRGEAGRRRAQNLFAISRVAAEVVSLYTQVLSADLAGRFDLSVAAAK